MRRNLQNSRMLFPTALLLFLTLLLPRLLLPQTSGPGDPAAALASALSAACRRNETQFADYLTADNSAAFLALPEGQRAAVLGRLSLGDEAGRPLLSSGQQNHPLLRCETPGSTVEFQFGSARTHENLAFIPVTAAGGHSTEFGMVREGGGWKLLSLGLVLFDIPQLSKQWAEQDIALREDAAIKVLKGLAEAIATYRHIYDKLPESLAQLGPAPKDQVSPDQAQLVNSHLAAGSQGGYRFRYRILTPQAGGEPGFELAASPEQYGKTGRRSFLLDAEGKLHAADKNGLYASAEDPEIPSQKAN